MAFVNYPHEFWLLPGVLTGHLVYSVVSGQLLLGPLATVPTEVISDLGEAVIHAFIHCFISVKPCR